MDACNKYGSLKMVLEIYDQIEEFKFKPNAAIMTYLLSGLSKNNQTMEEVSRMLKKHRDRQETELQASGLQTKLSSEISRRFDSARRLLGFSAGGEQIVPQDRAVFEVAERNESLNVSKSNFNQSVMDQSARQRTDNRNQNRGGRDSKLVGTQAVSLLDTKSPLYRKM